MGYIRRGRFHLLFSAGSPLGERTLGTDVPTTFKPLNAGPITYSQLRVPGYLSTTTVREIGASLGAPMCAIAYVKIVTPVSPHTSDVRSRAMEPGVSISFELTEKHDAAESVPKSYTKRLHDSWDTFARDIGHGDDIKPVLVTGVDVTGDFAMMAYSNDSVSLASEFTASAPTVGSASASAWGTWRTEGLVHTNCGPQLCCPPSSTRTTDLAPSSNNTEIVPGEYNQCVFVRYYTMRKRALVFPRVIRAAVGP